MGQLVHLMPPAWAAVTPAVADGREIIGMDHRGRIRLCRFYSKAQTPRPGWITLDECEDFAPLYFIPCPDRRRAIEAIFEQRLARKGGTS